MPWQVIHMMGEIGLQVKEWGEEGGGGGKNKMKIIKSYEGVQEFI